MGALSCASHLPELIERLAALIPPPRLHRHRYHGVLAPNAPQRAQLTALARPATPPSPAPLPVGDPAQHAERSPARILWALLLARIYEILPLHAVALTCASSPSSPAPQRSNPSSPAWASPPPHPKRPPPVALRSGTRRPSPRPTGLTPQRPCLQYRLRPAPWPPGLCTSSRSDPKASLACCHELAFWSLRSIIRSTPSWAQRRCSRFGKPIPLRDGEPWRSSSSAPPSGRR